MKYLLTFTVLSTLLLANEELSLDNDFLQSLDEVSEIATKTKLNIDDSPSFVTVLHSKKLKKLGITNVLEALEQVPGVQLKREVSGVPVVVFRGVLQKGEVKLMIDGVTINNSYRGSIYHYLDFPIEMIQRIEVIRGAGSVLYGSGAISGVVNIITNSSQTDSKSNAFISAGTHDSYKGGALFSKNIGDFKITLDGYYQKNDKLVDSTDRHLKDYSLGMHINDTHFSFLARVKKSDMGNAYGLFTIVDEDEKAKENKNSELITQLSYKNKFNKKNSINILAGYTRYGQDVESEHPSLGVIYATYEEESYYAQTDFISTILENNELLIGAKFESAKTVDSRWSTGPAYVSDPDSKRDTTSLYVNDKYSVHTDLDISAGLRYDNYSDFGDSFSPNFGFVYRVNNQVRLKALYSHAFRAPSWVELTSNPDLEAESSNSLEAGVVFKQNQRNTLRINFYTSRIEDMITKAGTYVQESENKFYGSEFEYIYVPNNKTELNFIASYVDAKDENGDDLPDIANILTSASLTYELDLGFSFGSLLKYTSASKRSDTDSRGDMSSSIIFDQTIPYQYKNFTASLIVKNLFDNEIYYSLPEPFTHDFKNAGRTILLSAAMEF